MATFQSPIAVSSPGKVILHGEHAVVYGKAALATSLDLRCYLILAPTQDREVTLHLPDFVPESDFKKAWKVPDLQALVFAGENSRHEERLEALKKFSGLAGNETPSILQMAELVFLYLLISIYAESLKELTGLSATVISTLPAGAGLGSSAAYSVALAAGLLSSCGKIRYAAASGDRQPEALLEQLDARLKSASVRLGVSPEQLHWSREDLEVINKWGFEAERIIHGTPSGIDNSTSTYGGVIKFESGVITNLEKIPSIRIMLINTKVPRSTKRMVAGVRDRYNKFPSVVTPILDSIGAITDTAQTLLAQLGDLQDPQNRGAVHSNMDELVCLNQHLLNALGVGHPAIDNVCTLAKAQGLNAKLTGGGGGGCVIALLPFDISDAKLMELKGCFEGAGFECWETSIACGGVCAHSVSGHMTTS